MARIDCSRSPSPQPTTYEGGDTRENVSKAPSPTPSSHLPAYTTAQEPSAPSPSHEFLAPVSEPAPAGSTPPHESLSTGVAPLDGPPTIKRRQPVGVPPPAPPAVAPAASAPLPDREPREPAVDWDEVKSLTKGAAVAMLTWSRSRFSQMFELPSFKWLLVALGFLILSNVLAPQISPFCTWPILNSICPTNSLSNHHQEPLFSNTEPTLGPVQWADYPSLMTVQSKTFNTLLTEAGVTPEVGMDIKKVEMAIGDLVILVEYSDLINKEELVRLLNKFMDDAEETGRGLMSFNSKIESSIDTVLVVNSWALGAIEDANSKSTAFWMRPFSRKPSKDKVKETFNDCMDTLSANMRYLMLEAEGNIGNLKNLEDSLRPIHALIVKNNNTLQSEKAEILSHLWTQLRGDERGLRGIETNVELLRNLASYRQTALAHVVGALQAIQVMASDMKELNKKVRTPPLVGGKIPLDVHIRSIQGGVQGLRERRLMARRQQDANVKYIMAEAV